MSADAFTDEKTGTSVYTAEVTIPGDTGTDTPTEAETDEWPTANATSLCVLTGVMGYHRASGRR